MGRHDRRGPPGVRIDRVTEPIPGFSPAPPAGVQETPSPAAEYAVATRGLVKSYGKHRALMGLDISVPRGRVYGFLGPNGSGKTTALRLLTGLLRPNAGYIWLFGQPYSWHDRKRLFRVGSLIETPSFYPYMTGRENLIVLAASGPPTPLTRVDQVLEYVGMSGRSKDPVQTYSLGMKQRLGIAAAMLSDPDLLLLDEPANGLDPGGMVAMRETLRWFTHELGKTVVMSSHLLHEVEQLADVVGIIDRGRLIREGSLDKLLDDAGRVRVRVEVGQMPQAASILRELAPGRPLYGEDSGDRTGWFTVNVPPARATEINRALADAGIYASGLEPGSDLESIFLEVTGAGGEIHERPDAGMPPPGPQTPTTVPPPPAASPPAAGPAQ
jgi:ABC-2 type transport system ATP-binding protein